MKKLYFTFFFLYLTTIFAGEYVTMGRVAAGLIPEKEADAMVQEIGHILRANPNDMKNIIVVTPDDGAEYQEFWNRNAPEWGAGLAIPGAGTVIIAPGRSLIKRVLKHELTHIVLHRKAGTHIPRWFDEGVAEHQSRTWSLDDNIKMSWLVLSGMPRLLDLESLYRKNEFSARNLYGYSYLAVNALTEEYGRSILADILDNASKQHDFEKGFQMATGMDMRDWDGQFQQQMYRRYGWLTFIFNSNFIWLGLIILFVIAGAVKIYHTRKYLRQKHETGQVILFPEDEDN